MIDKTMWCPHCNTESTAVPSNTVDGDCCANCGIALIADAPTDQTIRQARDIIAKWSASDLLDRISTLPDIPAMPAAHSLRPESALAPPEATTQDAVPVIPPGDVTTADQNTIDVSADEHIRMDEPCIDDLTSVDASSAPEEPPPTKVETPSRDVAPTIQSASEEHSPEAIASTPTRAQRSQQKRQPQVRQQRKRKRPDAASNKGSKIVSQNFRVDRPGSDVPEISPENQTNVAGSKIQSNSSADGRRHRIDSGQPVAATLDTGDHRSRTQTRPRQRFIDEAHATAVRGPHFEVTPQRRSNLTSLTGQFLAYLGVLGLTIGTAIVIYGHFGGYSEYTPTGWLVTTVAQMMLFLGVINLVSGGIEQNNNDVSQRINTLGEQLLRIEQVTEEALRGPKIPAHRYANPDAPAEVSRRATVAVRDEE